MPRLVAVAVLRKHTGTFGQWKGGAPSRVGNARRSEVRASKLDRKGRPFRCEYVGTRAFSLAVCRRCRAVYEPSTRVTYAMMTGNADLCWRCVGALHRFSSLRTPWKSTPEIDDLLYTARVAKLYLADYAEAKKRWAKGLR